MNRTHLEHTITALVIQFTLFQQLSGKRHRLVKAVRAAEAVEAVNAIQW